MGGNERVFIWRVKKKKEGVREGGEHAPVCCFGDGDGNFKKESLEFGRGGRRGKHETVESQVWLNHQIKSFTYTQSLVIVHLQSFFFAFCILRVLFQPITAREHLFITK